MKIVVSYNPSNPGQRCSFWDELATFDWEKYMERVKARKPHIKKALDEGEWWTKDEEHCK